MTEVRILGRGGQGAVTASQIIAIAAFYDGLQSQAFPMFGVERAGSPVRAYVRLSDKEIKDRTEICFPDYSIVLDPTLLQSLNVCEGVKKSVIVNCTRCISLKKETYYVDATSKAMEIIGKPFVNVAMVGAFAKVTGIITLKSINKAIDDLFGLKGKPEVIQKNKDAVKAVYDAVKK
ncbi:MAG: 2-oxoacid:acceptor oxidoreductase family protein [Nanoarchaeota archaeon]|nr:2-oxoacid:acceptor oxidoreductase family protein [Nanoarchaeota archaeon]